jgi:hypothetical protein
VRGNAGCARPESQHVPVTATGSLGTDSQHTRALASRCIRRARVTPLVEQLLVRYLNLEQSRITGCVVVGGAEVHAHDTAAEGVVLAIREGTYPFDLISVRQRRSVKQPHRLILVGSAHELGIVTYIAVRVVTSYASGHAPPRHF